MAKGNVFRLGLSNVPRRAGEVKKLAGGVLMWAPGTMRPRKWPGRFDMKSISGHPLAPGNDLTTRAEENWQLEARENLHDGELKSRKPWLVKSRDFCCA